MFKKPPFDTLFAKTVCSVSFFEIMINKVFISSSDQPSLRFFWHTAYKKLETYQTTMHTFATKDSLTSTGYESDDAARSID